MYKIPLKELKSYQESHPELYTKTELKKIKLRGTEPVAEYHNMNSHKTVYLYDKNAAIPYQKTAEELAKQRESSRRYAEKHKCHDCGRREKYALNLYYPTPYSQGIYLCYECYDRRTIEDYDAKKIRLAKKLTMPALPYERAFPQNIPAKTMRIVEIDTTGLNWWEDEILSVVILDGTGKTLYNALFSPEDRTSWSEAQAVNGISADMVRRKDTFAMHRAEILRCMDGAEFIITYGGIEFDLPFLAAHGVVFPVHEVCDLMYDCCEMYYNYEKLTTLSDAAMRYKVNRPEIETEEIETVTKAKTILALYNAVQLEEREE